MDHISVNALIRPGHSYLRAVELKAVGLGIWYMLYELYKLMKRQNVIKYIYQVQLLSIYWIKTGSKLVIAC